MISKRSKKRPPDLRAVSRQHPSDEEATALINAMFKGSPIVAAILGQSVLELELEGLLRPQFRRKDDITWSKVTGENGPLGTFSAKIVAAYAFGLIDDVTQKNLNIIRDIRNAFAHSKLLLDFENESVRHKLAQVAVPVSSKSRRAKKLGAIPSHASGRHCFLTLVDVTGAELARRAGERLRQKSEYLKRKNRSMLAKMRGPLLNALLLSK